MSQWTYAQQKMYRWQVAALNQATGGHYGDDERRALLEKVTGKASTGDMDQAELRRVIDEQKKILRQCGITQRWRSGPRTFSQTAYISHLEAQLDWTDPARLSGFIARQFGGWRRSVDDLNVIERSKLISSLSGLLKSERKGTASVDRPVNNRPRQDWTPQFIPGGAPAARPHK